MIKRVATRALMALSLISVFAHADVKRCSEPWWLWQAFSRHFVQADGRVFDPSTPKQHSTSEGQAYAMFFALMNNDAKAFEKIWRWSVDNLAKGNMRIQLPAWSWGKSEQGEWGVLDSNSASDADLWFVYALAEASQKWQRPDYLDDAKALLILVERHEVAELPGLGAMLLPGKEGFTQKGQNWVLNPSYLPLPVLRKVASLSSFAGWQQMPQNLNRLLVKASPTGFAPDWVAYQGQAVDRGVFLTSNIKGGVGSYDAIRTYLWAAVTHPDDLLATPKPIWHARRTRCSRFAA